ncbi:MAG: hypothetical protein ACON5A_03430 [Candidatus Comchoanobacterales bacterium]
MKSNIKLAIIRTSQKKFFPYMLFFGHDRSHIKHMLSHFNIQPIRLILLPIWLTKCICFILAHLPITWLSVKKLQDLVSQIHNGLEANEGTSKILYTMIAKNNTMLIRYYLISMLYQVQNGRPFSKAILLLLEDKNPFFASLIEEAEQGSQIKSVLSEMSELLLLKTRSKFQFIRIIIPALIAIGVCLFVGKNISYYVTAARYTIILQMNEFIPGKYPYSNIMAWYESFFNVDNFYYFVLRNALIIIAVYLVLSVIRKSKYYPSFLAAIELNIPFLRARQTRLISIELFKLLAISRISNMNIYQSLHRAKLHLMNKHAKNQISHSLQHIDRGVSPLEALKKLRMIPMSTHYILDRLINSTNNIDLITISELCSHEYDNALRMLNEAYRFLLIIVVLLLILFIGVNYIDSQYYYGLL